MKWLLLLLVLSLGGTLLARSMGQTQPSHPVLDGFRVGCTDQTAPCWYGIRPGLTTEGDYRQRLVAQGYEVRAFIEEENDQEYTALRAQHPSGGCTIWAQILKRGIITAVQLAECPSLRLGDVLAAFRPISVDLDCQRSAVYRIRLRLANGIIVEALPPFALESPVTLVMMSAETLRDDGRPWRGLAPRWVYCQ